MTAGLGNAACRLPAVQMGSRTGRRRRQIVEGPWTAWTLNFVAVGVVRPRPAPPIRTAIREFAVASPSPARWVGAGLWVWSCVYGAALEEAILCCIVLLQSLHFEAGSCLSTAGLQGCCNDHSSKRMVAAIALCAAPQAPTCTDGVLNGVETGQDCGGPTEIEGACPRCKPGQGCSSPSDCEDGLCNDVDFICQVSSIFYWMGC